MAVVEDRSIIVDGVSYDYLREEEIVPGKLKKYVIKEGAGDYCESGHDCQMHYTGTLASNDKKFDSSYDRNVPFDCQIGVGQLIQGWDKGVPTMKHGEKAVLTVDSELGYGRQGAGADIPANADLKFLVELLSSQPKQKDIWDMTEEEKAFFAEEQKVSGNSDLKAGHYAEAQKKYLAGIEAMQGIDEMADATLLKQLLNNSAICYKKTSDWILMARQCDKVLKLDASDIKALTNKAAALLENGDHYQAKTLLEKAIVDFEGQENQVESFKKALKAVTVAQKVSDRKEKAVYSKMFK